MRQRHAGAIIGARGSLLHPTIGLVLSEHESEKLFDAAGE
jgi:hypothetical protein